MRRLVTISAAFALALAVTTASGQPPKADAPKKADKPVPNPPDATDAAIGRALATDPDVKMAQAKINLAEAELAKARQTITLRVLALKSRVEQGTAEMRVAEQHLENVTKGVNGGAGHQSELLVARSKFETAKAALAAAEAEWKLLTGSDNNGEVKLFRAYLTVLDQYFESHSLPSTQQGPAPNAGAYRWYGSGGSPPATIKGPIPDRLRAVLDKPIKLGAKGETIRIDQALELLKKEVGFDVPVRGELLHPRPKVNDRGEILYDPARKGIPIMIAPQVVSEGETLPVGAWLQLYQDVSGGTFYVREYGLLLADKKSAPPDAPTLTEFWKQGAPKPEPKPKSDPAPEPKPK
ncbi:hypothetical protein R5W23_006089 [Gemmata sp. JC673]|uniref:Uncharacterized protein n=1 Tax=Gemmata algarum TaxID=2975278 RepID=A0ABU5EYM9_9BACT|nr:hypothetical protein [Gemmata algarum]MDY3558913.1 hypothetical protein [Gemmata algarum]